MAEWRIARVGDNVTVQIRGNDKSGTVLSGGGPGTASISIGPGTSVQLSGRIVENLGDSWLIELSMSIGGKNRIVVPKGAQK